MMLSPSRASSTASALPRQELRAHAALRRSAAKSGISGSEWNRSVVKMLPDSTFEVELDSGFQLLANLPVACVAAVARDWSTSI